MNQVKQLICDGAPRYRVGKAKILTYSEAWAEIVKQHKRGDKSVSRRGFKMLQLINRVQGRILAGALLKEMKRRRDEPEAVELATAEEGETNAKA